MDLDHIAKSTFRRRGTLKRFADCIGTTLAACDCSIYIHATGLQEWMNIFQAQANPSFDKLKESDAWAKTSRIQRIC